MKAALSLCTAGDEVMDDTQDGLVLFILFQFLDECHKVLMKSSPQAGQLLASQTLKMPGGCELQVNLTSPDG